MSTIYLTVLPQHNLCGCAAAGNRPSCHSFPRVFELLGILTGHQCLLLLQMLLCAVVLLMLGSIQFQGFTSQSSCSFWLLCEVQQGFVIAGKHLKIKLQLMYALLLVSCSSSLLTISLTIERVGLLTLTYLLFSCLSIHAMENAIFSSPSLGNLGPFGF